MCLHTVIAVIGPQRQKFGKIFMPYVQINGYGPLSHAELIYCHCRVIGQLNPSYYASGRSFETADRTAGCPHLAEIETHTATEFADFGKAVYTAVNPVKAVRHRIDEAG